jgi:ubiquitin C-terminal hydrolase
MYLSSSREDYAQFINSDFPNGGTTTNDNATLQYMMSTFTAHYNGNRQPFGLYTHPIHVSKTVPGTTVQQSTIDMINYFLDWAQQQPNGQGKKCTCGKIG